MDVLKHMVCADMNRVFHGFTSSTDDTSEIERVSSPSQGSNSGEKTNQTNMEESVKENSKLSVNTDPEHLDDIFPPVFSVTSSQNHCCVCVFNITHKIICECIWRQMHKMSQQRLGPHQTAVLQKTTSLFVFHDVTFHFQKMNVTQNASGRRSKSL